MLRKNLEILVQFLSLRFRIIILIISFCSLQTSFPNTVWGSDKDTKSKQSEPLITDEALDKATDLYLALRSWIYFNPKETKNGLIYVKSKDKEQKRIDDCFHNMDLSSFMILNTTELRSLYSKDRKGFKKILSIGEEFLKEVDKSYAVNFYSNQEAISKYPEESIKNALEHIEKTKDSEKQLDTAQLHQDTDSFFNADSLYTLLKETEFIIPIVPFQSEEFGIGNPNENIQPRGSLSYPQVLENFSETEKEILFEDFMLLFFVNNKTRDFDPVKEFDGTIQPIVNAFRDAVPYSTLFSSSPIDAFKHISAGLLPHTIICSLDLDKKKCEAIYKFYYEMLKSQPKKIQEINKLVISDLEKPYFLTQLNALLNISLTEKAFKEKIETVKILSSEEFHKYIKEKKGSISTDSEWAFIESNEFPGWFKGRYSITFDYDAYSFLENNRIEIKTTYVAKLYIEHLLDKARKVDSYFDLLEYIQARAHLRFLTATAVLRYFFIDSLSKSK